MTVKVRNVELQAKSMDNISDDFSVYVTIMNQTNFILQLVSQESPYGDFSPPTLPPLVQPRGEIFFSLKGNLITGSEGLVTYEVSGLQGKRITFAFSCPQVSDNNLSIPLNQTDLYVTYYGTNQAIQWDPYGSNWGPPNNFPTRGHPLYALFAIQNSV